MRLVSKSRWTIRLKQPLIRWIERMVSRPLTRGFLTSVLFAVTFPIHPSPAQTPNPTDTSAGLAHFVPASARVFFTARRLDLLDAALERTHAWGLLRLLEGAGAVASGKSELATAVSSFLGAGTSINVERLMSMEIGIIAESAFTFERAVWLVRLDKPGLVDHWFPRFQRRRETREGAIHQFITHMGMSVVVSGDLLVLARGDGADQRLTEIIVQLGEGDDAETLGRDRGFGKMLGQLPTGALAVVYLTTDQDPAASGGGVFALPGIRSAVIGIYERDGRIDIVLNGERTEARTADPLTRDAVARLAGLPPTTLMAVATRIDLREAYDATSESASTGSLGRYMQLLKGLVTEELDTSVLFPDDGSQVIFAWGQERRGIRSTPQFTILIECADADAVRAELDRIGERVLRILATVDVPKGVAPPTIVRETYLGTTITRMPVGRHAATSRFPPVRLLENVEPSWAVLDNWLVVALTPVHLQNVIDAANRLGPTLGRSREVAQLVRGLDGAATIAVSKPVWASHVVNRWLGDAADGKASLLDTAWWRSTVQPASSRHRALGVGMERRQLPGVVVVRRVYRDTRADGRLRGDDRIIGVNGRLLAMAAPNADLRRLLAETPDHKSPALRVVRDGAQIDVQLPPLKPATALDTLVQIGRSVRSATLSITEDDERFTAHLSLRFIPTRVP